MQFIFNASVDIAYLFTTDVIHMVVFMFAECICSFSIFKKKTQNQD